LVKYCDRPLCGLVREDGFDIVETGPKGRVVRDPRIRGRWAAVGDRTIIRLDFYSKWYEWTGMAIGSVVFGSAVAALATSAFRSLPISTFAVMVLCFAAVIAGLLFWRWHIRTTSQGEALAPKLAVLFEGEIREEAEVSQFQVDVAGH